jgi:hypothetical protein
VKDPKWKQGTAVDQFVTLRGALEGNLSNLEDALRDPLLHYDRGMLVSRCLMLTEELGRLKPFLAGELPWSGDESR